MHCFQLLLTENSVDKVSPHLISFLLQFLGPRLQATYYCKLEDGSRVPLPEFETTFTPYISVHLGKLLQCMCHLFLVCKIIIGLLAEFIEIAHATSLPGTQQMINKCELLYDIVQLATCTRLCVFPFAYSHFVSFSLCVVTLSDLSPFPIFLSVRSANPQ